LLTVSLFFEYEDVLIRPGQMARHRRTAAEVDDFLQQFAALPEPVEVHFRWRPRLNDPNDEMILGSGDKWQGRCACQSQRS